MPVGLARAEEGVGWGRGPGETEKPHRPAGKVVLGKHHPPKTKTQKTSRDFEWLGLSSSTAAGLGSISDSSKSSKS